MHEGPKQKEIADFKKSEHRDPKKLRWERHGDNHWRAIVKKTGEGHVCQKCGGEILAGGPASLTIDTDKPKKNLAAEDFKNIQYWHLQLKCPEPPVEDEPSTSLE